MKAIVRCAELSCTSRADVGSLYESSEIKHERHGQNAWLKATTTARQHAESTGHEVYVDMGTSHGLIQCVCATCNRRTPGKATGICDDCLTTKLEKF